MEPKSGVKAGVKTAATRAKRVELQVERFLFASRWLLVPIYLGLALSLFILVIKFAQEFLHLAAKAISGTEAEIMLGVLSLVDIAMVCSLLVIVIFSGYENFVSRIDPQEHQNWPVWLASIDFTGLKLKLLASIVVISGIQLLKQFMAVKSVADRELMWSVIIHLVFVVSSLLLALSDRITGNHQPEPAPVAEPTAAPAPPQTSKDRGK